MSRGKGLVNLFNPFGLMDLFLVDERIHRELVYAGGKAEKTASPSKQPASPSSSTLLKRR